VPDVAAIFYDRLGPPLKGTEFCLLQRMGVSCLQEVSALHHAGLVGIDGVFRQLRQRPGCNRGP
jgi:hypothetical protein